MTFLTEARKAADRSAPMGNRFQAFCHCLERFSPLGFQATREYLASLVGAKHRHWTPEQLDEALELLTQERDRRSAFAAQWEERRRRLKATGQRAVGRDETEEQASMPWLTWPRERIRTRRLVTPSAPPADAIPFRPADRADYEAIVALMPTAKHHLSLSFDAKIYDDWLRIPQRIYNPEPTADVFNAMSPQRQLMMHCLYTRHHDGHVRQRHLQALLEAERPWVAPYVVALVGEYVVEIVHDIAEGLLPDAEPRTAQRIVFGRFARENPAFMQLTRQRVWSYWRCYYAADYRRPERDVPNRPEYPGFVALRMLDAAAAER